MYPENYGFQLVQVYSITFNDYVLSELHWAHNLLTLHYANEHLVDSKVSVNNNEATWTHIFHICVILPQYEILEANCYFKRNCAKLSHHLQRKFPPNLLSHRLNYVSLLYTPYCGSANLYFCTTVQYVMSLYRHQKGRSQTLFCILNNQF